jgi:hypothetical protein
MEGWFVSKNDVSKYSVIEDFIQGRIPRKTAALMLGRSERQVSRLATQGKVSRKALQDTSRAARETLIASGGTKHLSKTCP